MNNLLTPFILFVGLIGMVTTASSKKLKIYISADMEGVVGVVTDEQLGPKGFEYQRFREFMTKEVSVAVEAAFEAGATEVLVSDSHGNGQNLLIERLPKDVKVVRSWPRPLMMMQGIDETFDGAIFLGYHSSTTNPEGVRAHTMSSARLTAVHVNGIPMSEGSFNAAIAGHFGVPIIMVSGDDAAVEEVQSIVGDIEGAIVKWNYGFHSAKTLHPEAGYELIAGKVKSAIERIDAFKPYEVKKPVILEVTFKNYRPSEILAYLPIVERIDSHSIRYIGKDMVEVSKFMEFLLSYSAGESEP